MSAPQLRTLTALEELEVLRRAPALLPLLLDKGLSLEDSMALAHNAALLFYALDDERLQSPRSVLEEFSLAAIAALCEKLEALACAEKEETA